MVIYHKYQIMEKLVMIIQIKLVQINMLLLIIKQDKFLVVNIVFIIKGLLKKTPMEYVKQTTHHEIYY